MKSILLTVTILLTSTTQVQALEFPCLERLCSFKSIPDESVHYDYDAPHSMNWTWPGGTKQSLINHLLSHPNHGLDAEILQTKTLAELEAIHNSDHEGMLRKVEVTSEFPLETEPVSLRRFKNKRSYSIPQQRFNNTGPFRKLFRGRLFGGGLRGCAGGRCGG